VLRRVWTFDGSDRIPSPEAVREVLKHVGWHRVEWDGRRIRLDPGMEIDLGGIGKEYASDRSARRIAERCAGSCLVNLGGDLVVTRPRTDLVPWLVGIENPDLVVPTAARSIRLTAGALATSGDARRYLIRDGVRYGHVLDPTTGWPVTGGPRSVTVAAGTCVDAGTLATMAMLQGRGAKAFLETQGVRFWTLG
jgi:thiamine biosynthesis lipoprotein